MNRIFKNQLFTDIVLALTCFLTYSCVYAFRKPFTIGFYENEQAISGIHFKSLLIISQVLGYTCSKFLGIKLISELKNEMIEELSDYINYVNTQESTLHQAEKQKESFKNIYFTKPELVIFNVK